MSFDLQAEGLNGVNFPPAIVAGGGWNKTSDFVLSVSGTALEVATTVNVDAILGQGNLTGCGVMGFGSFEQGSGVVGVAGNSVTPPPLNQGKNIGVFGTGVGGGATGVFGESESGIGVIGQSQKGVGILGRDSIKLTLTENLHPRTEKLLNALADNRPQAHFNSRVQGLF